MKLSDITLNKKDKTLVYISHPSGGKECNTLEIQEICETLVNNKYFFENFTYVSPVHNYGFMYNSLDYETGLKLCLNLLDKCDIMFVFGDHESSKGCTREIEYCKQHEIPYIIVGDIEALRSFIN